MKRAVKGKTIPKDRSRDVRQVISKDQLAAIGAVTLCFNDLQADMEALLQVVVRVPDQIFLEISSRINGAEGKIAIIDAVIDDALTNPKEITELKSTIGIFKDLKTNRDAIIHARIINAALGWNSERRAQEFEVLLNADALNIFYDHMLWLQKAFPLIGDLLGSIFSLSILAQDDQKRPSFEEEIRDRWAQFRGHLSQRQSLKPMPKFPTEDELRTEASRRFAAEIPPNMGWYQPFLNPRTNQRYFRSDHLYLSQQPQMSTALWEHIAREDAKAQTTSPSEKK